MTSLRPSVGHPHRRNTGNRRAGLRPADDVFCTVRCTCAVMTRRATRPVHPRRAATDLPAGGTCRSAARGRLAGIGGDARQSTADRGKIDVTTKGRRVVLAMAINQGLVALAEVASKKRLGTENAPSATGASMLTISTPAMPLNVHRPA
jgi:hypothetical protein